MVVRYVTAHCEGHSVPDIRCRLVVRGETFQPVSLFSLALKSSFSKADSLSGVSLVKIARVTHYRQESQYSIVIFCAKVKRVGVGALKNLFSRMLCKWIIWSRGRDLQKSFFWYFFLTLRSREKEKKTRTISHISVNFHFPLFFFFLVYLWNTHRQWQKTLGKHGFLQKMEGTGAGLNTGRSAFQWKQKWHKKAALLYQCWEEIGPSQVEVKNRDSVKVWMAAAVDPCLNGRKNSAAWKFKLNFSSSDHSGFKSPEGLCG